MKTAIRKTGCGKLILVLAGALTLLSLAPPVRAATIDWSDSSGNWNVASNWNLGRVPANGDDVRILNSSGSHWTVTYNNPNGGTQTFNSLTLNASAAGAAEIWIQTDAYTLKTTNETIGSSGTGTFTQSGGTHAITNTLTWVITPAPAAPIAWAAAACRLVLSIPAIWAPAPSHRAAARTGLPTTSCWALGSAAAGPIP